MNQPLVSIIMTNYNHEDFVGESIRAVLAQTYTNFELIIVDDGSDDGSVSVIRSFEDARIQLYAREENVHIAAATNDAMQFAKGDYVAIADSDDVWCPDKLERQVQFLTEHPEYEACFTWVDIIDETGSQVNDKEQEVRDIFNASTDTQEEWLRFFFYVGNRLANPTSIVSMKAAKDVGEHNIAFVQGHDFEWWVRFTKKYRFAIIEEPLMKYRRYVYADKENTSSKTREHDIRFYNEYMMLRRRFFDGMDKELFVAAFAQDFKNPDSKTEEELLCEQAFLLCKGFNGSDAYVSCGPERLYELLQDERMCAVLKERFGFGQKDFYKLNGSPLYTDAALQRQLSEMEMRRSMLESEVENLQKTARDLNELLEGKKKETQNLLELLEVLKAQNCQLELDKGELQSRLEQKEEEAARLNEAVLSIQNSVSWKVTKPIRGVKKVLSSGERKNG